MPFTPYHMGAGIAIKAVAQRRFSLLVFGWSQVLIDLQPLYVIVTGHGIYHGLSHSYLGAAGVAAAAAISGRYLFALARCLPRRWRLPRPAWSTAAVSALAGTWSHVLIDSITHRDVHPFAPFSLLNPFPGQVSRAAMEVFLVYCGIVGGVAWYLLRKRRHRPQPH